MDLAGYIDHTLLKPDATKTMLEKLCEEAIEYGFHSVCVNPLWVPFCSEILFGSKPCVCSVAGFPLGASPLAADEAAWAVARGAGEIDMVIPIGLLKSSDAKGVARGISRVVNAVPGIPVKVILETCLLTDKEKVDACRISEDSGAAFVKTSTGFSIGGATPHDVRLMRAAVGSRLGVKASGGIHTREEAEKMIEAGASRIGASCSIAIINGNK